MKVITVHFGESKIELRNTIWGKETILVNDKLVSSKYTAFGGTGHKFMVDEDGEEANYSVKYRMGFGVAFDIWRNGEPVLESPKYGFWRLALLLIFAIVSFRLMAEYGWL